MKNKIILVLILMLSQISFAHGKNQCPNKSALVKIEAAFVEDFKFLMSIISSMSLSGKVIAEHDGIAVVEVSTWFLEHNSFDVATKVTQLVSDKIQKWGIRSIDAGMCFDISDFNPSNVGTIGHRSTFAQTEGKFLGSFHLKFSPEVWWPEFNDVPIGDITHDKVYADFELTTTDEYSLIISHGNISAFGCETNSIAQKWTLAELDSKNQILNVQLIPSSGIVVKENSKYVVRIQLAGLKKCQGFGFSFLALQK
ncbi:MAG: hypothetical protein ACK5P5_02510 [Pseudobdellovibrionaceae bacterium]